MAAIKHSKQRDAIKCFLESRKDHPSAEVVYNYVRKEYPNISLGTVYRNLTFLVEHGEAVTVPCNDDVVHYDACVKPHIHFQCNSCNCLIDIDDYDDKNYKQFYKKITKNFSGDIKYGSICFYGLCDKCK